MTVCLVEPSQARRVEIPVPSVVQRWTVADSIPTQRVEALFEAPQAWSLYWVVYDSPDPEAGLIDSLEEGYTVVNPIPYEIERLAPGDYVASFPAANIAIGGTSAQDAYQSLIAEILDTYDALSAPGQQLSPAAAQQLQQLQIYIVRP